jgi:hypothetical protein
MRGLLFQGNADEYVRVPCLCVCVCVIYHICMCICICMTMVFATEGRKGAKRGGGAQKKGGELSRFLHVKFNSLKNCNQIN